MNTKVFRSALFLAFWLLCPWAFSQPANTPVGKLNAVLEQAKNTFDKDKVFVKTDKDIYSPGEKIWFYAQVYNALTQQPSSAAELIVMLKGENGEVIGDSRYVLINGQSESWFQVPSWSPEGNVYLVAYTSAAIRANDASLAAVKPLIINTYRKNDFIIDAWLNKEIYTPGEDVKLSVKLTSLTPGHKKEKLEIALYDRTTKKYSQKFTLAVNQVNELKIKLPSKVYNCLSLTLGLAGKGSILHKIPLRTTDDNISVEFYPEGGVLLANNIQRILYRATDPFGMPIDIEGNVFDQFGNQAGAGKIVKKGYGLISLMAMPGQKYSFKITDPYGKNLEFELPVAQPEGAVFSLLKTEDSTLKAAVFTSGKYEGQPLTLAAVAAGEMVFSVPVQGAGKSSVKIATSALPPGIVNFVVLGPQAEILSQRLVFNASANDSLIGIKTLLEPSPANGDTKIRIDLSGFQDRYGPSKLNVKVVDKFALFNTAPSPYRSFLKYPLLTPVPQTVLDIYLTNLELIANEMRHFSLAGHYNEGSPDARPSSKNISGVVVDKNHKGVAKATVMAIQPDNMFQATTHTDARGRFSFEGMTKSKDVIVKAFSSSGKKSYTVHLDQTFDESLDDVIFMESFLAMPEFNEAELVPYCKRNRELLRLLGSEYHEPKPAKISNTEKLLQSGATILDVIKMTRPFRLDGNQIVFYGSENSFNFQSGALIVIDGQKMGTDIAALNMLNPTEVMSINISTNPVDIQRYTGLNSVGLIEITTRGNLEARRVEGNEKASAEIVSKRTAMTDNVWRYQTTLAWENNIPVAENGVVEIDVKLSDIQSEFVVFVDVESLGGISQHRVSTFSTVKKGSEE
jgi:hypothetical protein